MSTIRHARWISALGIAVLLGSCASPKVEQLELPLVRAPVLKPLLNPDKLTPETRSYLAARKLDRTYRKAAPEMVAPLLEALDRASSADRLALIELCLDAGEQLAADEPGKAVGFHLAAAELAFEASVNQPGGVPYGNEFGAAYNHSTGRVARILFDAGHDWNKATSIVGPGKTYRLNSRTRGEGFIDPDYFDTLNLAEYLKFEDVKFERIRREGVGASMVGHRKFTAERQKSNPLLPTVGMGVPVNATLDFSRVGNDVELAFHDLLVQENTRLAGRSVPLAADLSAPLAILLNYEKEKKIGMKGLLHPEDYINSMGLYELEPFRADRIPVIFVHGLMSSPETWVSALNQLRADPVLRKRYQIFLFRYPTGFPIAYNSSALRHHLKEFQERHDPGRRNPRMRNMVLVGHSMGGMLSNAQIRRSGDTLTHLLFERPMDEIDDLDEVQKKVFKDLLVYDANPDITRAVFIASPHRGSKIARGAIGALGSNLIKFPLDLLTAEPFADIDGLTEGGYDLIKHRPDSISGLRPDSPLSSAMLKQPIRKGVTVHSIIGRHKPTQPLQESSDEVVSYSSAHLDVAASEKVVHATHTTITGNPDAIEEVRRILYLHAGLPYSVP